MRVLLLAFLMLGLAPSAANAAYGAFDMGALTGTLSQDHVTKSEEARAGRDAADPTRSPIQALSQSIAQQTRGVAAPAAEPVSASYRPTEEVRARITEIIAEDSERRQAGTGAEVRKLIESGEPLNEFNRVAPQMGLQRNDAIDALAFYLIGQWVIANNHQGDIGEAQVMGVRRQSAAAYATIADQLGTDAIRQEFAETLAIQGAMMLGGFKTAIVRNDSALIDKFVSLARQGGRQLFTMDPAQIALTDEGFRRKSDLGALSLDRPDVQSVETSARLAVAEEPAERGELPLGVALALLAVAAAGVFAIARSGTRKG